MMQQDKTAVLEEQWTDWLAAGDDVLAAGGADDPLPTVDMPARLRSELRKDLAYSQRVRQALRRQAAPATVANTDPEIFQEGVAIRWTPTEGQRRLGRFEVLELVGSGGFGMVFKARDPDLQRVVAIKIPRAGRLNTAEDLDRFFREASNVAQLRHPAIVPIHEVGQLPALLFMGYDKAGSVPYLVSEFVHGTTLSDHLAQRPTALEAAQLLATVADALQYAHEQGVVHRDVKPSNILMDEKGRPHLMDFGLARREAGDATLTSDGQVLGTPAYMCPEQACGQAHYVDGRGDIYSLGVVLYQLLTGVLPFQGNVRVILQQVMHKEPPAPRSLNPRVQRDLETICLKAMAKEPCRRYQTAGALAADLRHFLAGLPIQARPISQLEHLWRWCRRNPAVASLLSALAVALFSGALIATMFAIQSGENAAHALREKARADDKARAALASAEQAKEAEKRKSTELTRAQWLVYASQLAAAQREWELGRTDAAWEHLDACRPEYRGWEHRYLAGLFTRNQLTLRGHSKRVGCVAISPDATRIASGSDDGMVKVWDADTGREIFTSRPKGRVAAIAFSPDGKLIASCVNKGVTIWDSNGGHEIFTFKRHQSWTCGIAFSPNGQRIVSCDVEGMIRVWNAASGQEIFAVKAGSSSAAFSADGLRVITNHEDDVLKVWDPDKGLEIISIKSKVPYLPANALSSADGQRIVTADMDGVVKVWEGAKGHSIPALALARGEARAALMFKAHAWFSGVALTCDGQRLVTCGELVVKVWDPATGQNVLTFKGHTGYVRCLAVSADGRRIVTGSDDATVKVWDPAKHQQLSTIKAQLAGVTSLAFSPAGKHIAGGGQSDVLRVWDVATKQQIFTKQSQIATIKDAINGKEAWWFNGPANSFNGATISPDGKRIASISSGKTVKVWDTSKGAEILAFNAHAKMVKCVAFSPDSKRVASGAFDNRVLVWSVDTGQVTLELPGHSAPIGGLAFSADGKKLASASQDKTVKVWDADTGLELFVLRGHTGWVNCVAFSHDSQRIFTAASDHTVKVWNAEQGLEVLTLRGHTGSVSTLALDPHHHCLISGGLDDSIHVWEAEAASQTNPN